MINHNLKNPLSNYLVVTANKKLSLSIVASKISAKECDNIDILWEEHEHQRKMFKQIYKEHSILSRNETFDTVNNSENEYVKVTNLDLDEPKPSFSYLDLKVKIAEKMFQNCNFCEKACGVDRTSEKGECAVDTPRIASEFLHVGEEPPLVPSHTVFFVGCNFGCVFCQNWDISRASDRGMTINPEDLAVIIEKRRNEGSRNVNFVGGDPTPNLLFILRTIKHVRENIPVIWNSNMYLSKDAMNLLDGFVDLYLTDFKYGNNTCAMRLSGIQNYIEVVGRNHKLAYLAGEVIIRHLVLPNHVDCCSKPLLEWISQNLGSDVIINIMGQYHPVYHAQEHEDIFRFPHSTETGEVVQYAKDLGFKNLI